MKSSTVKTIFLSGLVFIGLIIAISLYYNRGFVVFIKGEQISSVSTDQCSFSFINKNGKKVNVIISAEGDGLSLLDPLTPTSSIQIHAPSKKSITATGEVKAQVWIDGNQIFCKSQL
jgi:hypothetical protein